MPLSLAAVVTWDLYTQELSLIDVTESGCKWGRGPVTVPKETHWLAPSSLFPALIMRTTTVRI